MTTSMSLRLSDDLLAELENLANRTDRSKSYLVKKAIEQYLEEYSDYKIALDRLNDKDDMIISSKDMRKLLGS